MKWTEVPICFFSQSFNELIAIDFETLQIQLNYKKMPCMLDIVPAGGNLDFLEICESFRVIHGDALSGFPELIAFLQLFDADGSRNVSQIVLKSRVENFIVPRTFLGITFPSVMADSMEAHHPHPLGPF